MKEYTKNMIRQIKCCEEKLIYIERNNTKIALKIWLCKKITKIKRGYWKIIGL